MKNVLVALLVCWSWLSFAQCPGSPILIDTTGEGLKLTDVAHGVEFDITGTGKLQQIAWTQADSDNAFLVLDRTGKGLVNGINGKDLFGNYTEQGGPFLRKNGFNALSEFDQPINGGNGDGVIDARDPVFSHLLLWIDRNHDGKAQANELNTLPQLGVYSLSLKYTETPRTDQYGNFLRYRAEVNPEGEPHTDKVGRYAYDVFFLLQ